MNSRGKLALIVIISMVLLTPTYALTSVTFFTNAPRIHLRSGVSSNWSGYAVETNLASPQMGSVSDVKGSWTVPAVDCSATPSAYSSFWVGIDGYASSTVEQTGTDSDCSSGVPKYYAWYEMYPKFPVNLKMTISPGDLMTGEVQFIGKGSFRITITDTTTGATFTTTQKSTRAQRSSAEWVAEAPSSSGGVLPLANFGTVNFQNAQVTINGITGTINNGTWQNDAITMTTQSGTVKAQPSALSTDGSSFSVTWRHS
ncbi:MAG: G1 family endopeptidase [Thaumarchaeota archaeon]|nr:G1 family endopeptidase [Nitrososphaerota archaeon]MCL5318693.1 G1 family endopeptidase [Nitrososphaerota archaeon]